MNRWVGKVAVVTGASSGIGAAIAKDLTKSGMITVGLARKADQIDRMKLELPETCQNNLIGHKCDVRSEDEIKSAFNWIEKNYGGVDVLVNNAGIYRLTMILNENNSNDINDLVKTNFLSSVFCIREAFRSMKTRTDPGHIININSIAGHYVGKFLTSPGGSLNLYPSTKFALTALNEVVRQELLMKKTKIKITNLSPGSVATGIVNGNPEHMRRFAHLQPADVSDAVLYVLGTPEGVQIHELTIKPLGEKY